VLKQGSNSTVGELEIFAVVKYLIVFGRIEI
jgi:hypothetical protein